MNQKFKILPSANFKYFAAYTEEYFFLFREKSLLWKKKFPSTPSSVIGVGNNGLVLVKMEDGFFTYYPAVEDPTSPIESYMTSSLNAQGIRLGQVFVEESGDGLIVEKVMEKTKSSPSFLKMLSKDKIAQTSVSGQLVLYNINSASEEIIWRFNIEREKTGFSWACTRNLDFVIVAEEKTKPFPQKGSLVKMLLFGHKAGKSHQEITISDTKITELMVNEQGIVGARMEFPDEVQYLGIKLDGNKFFVTPPQVSASLIHVGKNMIVFEEKENKIWHFRSFEDKGLFSFDFKLLEKLDIDYHFFFKANDDAVVVGIEEDERTLRMIYSTFSDLEILYKGWQLEVQNKKTPEKEKSPEQGSELQTAQVIQNQSAPPPPQISLTTSFVKELRPKEIPILQENLKKGEDLKVVHPGAAYSNRIEIIQKLEQLKLQKITGNISEETYELEKRTLENLLKSHHEKSPEPLVSEKTTAPIKKQPLDFIPLDEE
jgi:hypothetical protein